MKWRRNAPVAGESAQLEERYTKGPLHWDVSKPCAVAIIPCSCLVNEETVSGVQTRELLHLGSLYSTSWTIIDYVRYLVSDR